MRSIHLPKFLVILGVCLCAGSVTRAGLAGPQASIEPAAAAPSQSQRPATPKKTAQKPVQYGVWHHFGEEGPVPKVVPRISTPRQDFSGGRIVQSAPRQSFSSNRIADLERQMWSLVNRDRANPENAQETKGGNALPLRWNEKLAEVARAHSRDMMEQQFFDHVDREGKSPAARINAAGIRWQALGENIAINPTMSGGQNAFMNEPRFQANHRANILSVKYTDVGIGIVQDRQGGYYITQDFIATPTATHASGNDLGDTNQPRQGIP